MESAFEHKNIKHKCLKGITVVSFLSLAAFPIMKENLNSITIIICSILFVINFFLFKSKSKPKREQLFLTIIFWMFFIYELLTLNPSLKRILLYLPFLIFPVLFAFKPFYINEKEEKMSLNVFQASVFAASIYYILVFLVHNSISSLFEISPENIPFFRDYISKNAKLDIHPTYFSTFLLISFNISTLKLLYKRSGLKPKIIYVLNIVFTCFMIFLFSTRIVIIVLLITTLIILIRVFKNLNARNRLFLLATAILIGIGCIVPSKKILLKRFSETITEFNKPVEKEYHNSTNIRVAILKCSFFLLKETPLFGYGNQLQDKLNDCYQEKFDSNFSQNKNYNTHNYYLNLLLYGGILFFLLFIGYLFKLTLMLKNSYIGMLILIQIILISVTENFLSRHYGIITFNYFLLFFIFFKNKKLKTIEQCDEKAYF